MLRMILKYGTVFVVVMCLAITPFLTVSAAEPVSYNISIQKPIVSDRTYYIEILDEQASSYVAYVIIIQFASDFDGLVIPTINSSTDFSIGLFGGSVGVRYSVLYIGSNYNNLTYKESSYLSSNSSSDSVHFSFQNIVSVHYYGLDVQTTPPNATSVPFVVNYSSNGLTLDKLDEIKSSLGEVLYYEILSYGLLDEYLSYLEDIESNTATLDSILPLVDSIFQALDSILTNSEYNSELISSINTLIDDIIFYLDLIQDDTTSLYDELTTYLYPIWEYIDNDFPSFNQYLSDIESNTFSVEYFLHNDLVWYLSEYLTLFEDYFSLQNELITEPPSSSDDLSDSIENNLPREDGKDIVDELDSAQNEALGGKSPEDVKDEIEDTLDSDKLKEEISEEDEIEFEDIELEDITIVNQNVFNVVFDAFGGKWASYVVLTLSLSFAAFVIGRRF